MATDPPNDKETALRLYTVSIAQYMERIKLRDGVIKSFVVAAGVIGGFAAGDLTRRTEILLLIPVLAGATGFLSAYNSLLVDAILSYSADDIGRQIGVVTRTFDQHPAFVDKGMLAVRFRVTGYLITLIVPTVFSLYEVVARRGQSAGVLPWSIAAATVALAGIAAVVYSDIYYHQKRVRERANGIRKRTEEAVTQET